MKQIYTREQKLQVLELRKEGYKINEIAEKLNMKPSYVQKVCLMPHMVDKDINAPRKKTTNEEIIQIINLRKNNVSVFKIGEQFKKSTTCIENITKDYKKGKYDFLINLYENSTKKEEKQDKLKQEEQEEQQENLQQENQQDEQEETYQAIIYTQNENDISIIKQHLDILFDVVKDLQKKYEELNGKNS